MATRAEFRAKWTARLADARQLHALVPLEHVAAEVLADLQQLEQVDNDVLAIQEAARLSGYSEDTLRRMIAHGKIPQAGRRNKPAIRRADLPRKPGHAAALPSETQGDQLSPRRRIVLDATTTPPGRRGA
jgi:hypothetical protein